MSNAYLRKIYLQLAGVVTLVVLLALAANAVFTHHAFEEALAPQMARKVASVGSSIRALVVRGIENDLAFDKLFGVEERFDEVKNELPEVSFVALTDTQGRVVNQRMDPNAEVLAHLRSPGVLALLKSPDQLAPAVRVGKQYVVSMPIAIGTQALGILHIGVDVRFVDDIVLDMLYDILIVLVVSLFFTMELLHFMAGANLDASLRALGDGFERGASGNFQRQRRRPVELAFGALLRGMDAMLARVNAQYEALAREVEAGRRVPAHERHPGLAAAQAGVQSLAQRYRFGDEPAQARGDDVQLAKVRTPLFVFILAEELTRSFLPGYVQDLSVPVSWLSPQLVVGLPIALFMLIVALAQPFVGAYTERAGHRHTMLIGAAIAALGFLASSMAQSVLDLLLWRSLCGLGYAMVFVAAQAYVLDHATPSTRARSFALFVGAIMAASVCGPSIGGILADNIGERPTFFIAALLAAGSMLVIQGLPSERPGSFRATTRLPRLSEIGSLLMNRRFMTVTGLAAMPAKMLLTGLCFYLVPLYVLSIGSSQAMAGRVLMTYAVAMVVLSPLTATLATDRRRMHWLVAGGLMISGLGGVLMLAGGGVGWVFIAVALVGLGQSMSISAQSALVSEHCEREIAELGEGTVYGVYRLLERLGNALGPLVAAGLLHALDYRNSFVAIGGGVLLCGIAFLAATRHPPKPTLSAAGIPV